MDYRSFALNFEVNAFIYDEEIAEKKSELHMKMTLKIKIINFRKIQ